MATHIKDTIKKFFKKRGDELKKYEIIKNKTQKILDKETQKYIHINKISEKEVVFVSDTSSATYNFNLKKEEILKEIKAELPGVKKLRVKISNG